MPGPDEPLSGNRILIVLAIIAAGMLGYFAGQDHPVLTGHGLSVICHSWP